MDNLKVATAPGTWRVSDDSPTSFEDAQSAWAAAAREVLIETAKRYHEYITYKDLAAAVQERSGIATRTQTRTWIGATLVVVADECHDRGEPSLTALCVNQDETVGAGYKRVFELSRAGVPDDLDQHAAGERQECYRFFGAELPEGGGHPELTVKVAAARKRYAKANVAPPVLCPRCFVQLPSSGQCDDCD